MDIDIYVEAAYSRIAGEPSVCGRIAEIVKGQDFMEGILQKGEQEKKGYFILPGTGNRPFFTGNPPLWKENPVGDEEYVWGLNRHGHWKDYILCYCAFGDRTYLERIRLELFDWIKECPCPELTQDPVLAREVFCSTEKADPWRSLETGIRMFDSWNYAIPVLIQEGFMTEKEFAVAAQCIWQHAELLYRIAPLLWPQANHNHYIMENLGLLYASELLRELPQAEEWAMHANRELTRCVRNQLTEEGGQIEGSPSYHAICMEYFCKWLLKAQDLQLPVDGEARKRIRNGMAYTLSATRPTGVSVPWGDSDASEDAVIPAALMFRAFGEAEWLGVLAGFLGWDEIKRQCRLRSLEIGEFDWEEIMHSHRPPAVPLVNWQKELDQVMMRSDWGKDASSVFCGCHIPCFNGHAHIDPASFDFCACQKALVVDPGRFTYKEGPDRRTFKSAMMHNTLILGEKEPYDYVTRWLFKNEKNGCILQTMQGDGFMAAQAVHSSYFPTIHTRLFILLEAGVLVIWDRLEHYRGQKVDIYFHLDALHVKQEERMVCTQEDVSLAIMTTANLKCELLEGRLSERIDCSRPTVRVRYTNPGGEEGETDYMTVLVPFRSGKPEISDIAIDKEQSRGVFTCNQKRYQILWKGDECCVETD